MVAEVEEAEETKRVNILVVEDHVLVREGLVTALKEFELAGEIFVATEANEAVRVMESATVGLVLLDLMLPGVKGQTFLRILRRRFPAALVVVLSARDDPTTVSRVIQAGAAGFVSKSNSCAGLLSALREVLDGKIHLPTDMLVKVERSDAGLEDGNRMAQRFGLTMAQARVLELLAEGRGNAQIAELLGLTEGTVKVHVSAILKAMGLSNRSEVALVASRRRD